MKEKVWVLVSRNDWTQEELDYWTENTSANWVFGN
jgi:hypothetical protein